MKKVLAVLLAVLMLNVGVFAVAAEEQPIRVAINDEFIDFTDAHPIAMSGRTMVPVRAVFESLGAEFTVDGGKISATFPDGSVMVLELESTTLTLTDAQGVAVATEMDIAPWVDTSVWRTYIPVRFVSEATGLDVQWDSVNRVVHVTDYNALSAEFNQKYTTMNQLFTLDSNFPAGQSASVTLACSIPAGAGAAMTLDIDMLVDNDENISGSFTMADGIDTMKMSFILNVEDQIAYVEMGDLMGQISEGGVSGEMWLKMDLAEMTATMGLEMPEVEETVDMTIGDMVSLICTMMYEENGMSPTTYARTVNSVLETIFGDESVKTTKSGTKTTYAISGNFDALKDLAEDVKIDGTINCTFVEQKDAMVDVSADYKVEMTADGETMSLDMVIKLVKEMPAKGVPDGALVIDYNELV